MGLEASIDRQGSCLNNDKAAKWLNTHFENNQLFDLWRITNPDINGFTWRRLKPKPAFSRLDYIISSESVLQYVDVVDIWPGFQTDHSIVNVKLRFNFEKRGPGYWKLNSSLLHDTDYVDRINKLLDIHIDDEDNMYKSNAEKWELMKLAVRGSTIQYAARK